LKTLLDVGKGKRIWPFYDSGSGSLIVTISRVRGESDKVCLILRSRDSGEHWDEIVDLLRFDPRNTTTGQPFVTADGSCLVPIWDQGFYKEGQTGFAIYRSDSSMQDWKVSFSNPEMSYANHFFQDPKSGDLFIGAGKGGGGSGGKIRYTPASSCLLRSEDDGQSWDQIHRVPHECSLYDGTVVDGRLILSTRENRTLLIGEMDSEEWREVSFNSKTRSVEFFSQFDRYVVTSDDRVYVSKDLESWDEKRICRAGLVLRYPVVVDDVLFICGVGPTSLIISSRDLTKFEVCFDSRRHDLGPTFNRMCTDGKYLYLGDELSCGRLLQVDPFEEKWEPVGQVLPLATGLLRFLSRRTGIRSTKQF
jgi:hypothetical protein